jgi:Beta-lactamase class C and other penicillin binding proteins
MKRLLLTLGSGLVLTAAILMAIIGQKPHNQKVPMGFASFVEDVFREWNLPGLMVVVVKDGQTVFLKGYGKTALDSTGTAVDGDTPFILSSCSKAFTAALLATVIDEGKLKWGDTVVNHLPDFQLYDPWVTQNFLVRDILTHKTGFRPYAADKLPHFGYTRDEMLRLFRHIQPDYSYRSLYGYNNHMPTVAAQLIEKYTKKSWAEALSERIFTPLGMTNSLAGELPPMLPKAYQLKWGGDSIYASYVNYGDRANTWLSATAPACFVISTGNDIAHWMQMWLHNGKYEDKEIVSERAFRYLLSPQTITGIDSAALYSYAQGWSIEQGPHGRTYRHTGLAFGHSSFLAFIPEMKLGVAVFSNNETTTRPLMSIFNQLRDSYLKRTKNDWLKEPLVDFWSQSNVPNTPKVSDPVPSLSLNAYAGEYFLSEFGTARVYIQDDKLYFTLKKVNRPLYHKDGNVFGFYVPGLGNTDVSFVMKDGRAEALILDADAIISPFVRIK